MNAQSENFAAALQRELFVKYQTNIYRQTDRLFAALLALEWFGGVAVALWLSPRTWAGARSTVHPHVWAAIVFGAFICLPPILLASRRSGRAATRHAVAIGQVLMSSLLIHLTGGRIETHFHIFGSLAFLACYRDWTVLITATIVVAADHFLRGAFWPASVYGVSTVDVWRTLEHAGWIVFEDVFLIFACVRSRDELRSISAREAQMWSLNQSIEQQVVERTIALSAAHQKVSNQAEELQKSAAAAAAANVAKTEFLANMSHEIRTPMNAILGYADLLINEGDISKAPPARVEALRTIQRNGEHLLTIINDILDLSKLDADKMSVEAVECSPLRLVADVESLMRVRARSKNICLESSLLTDVPATIQSDPTRIRQILVNLVGNAIKFTEHGGVRIEVALKPSAKPTLHFDVVDTGLGMTDEQAARLFQPFTQADTSTTRHFGGTGLGLTISRRLARLLGGDVVVLRSKPGQGTTFRLTVPLGSTSNVDFISPAAAQRLLRDEAPSGPVSEPVVRDELQGLKILLVEDGPDNQRLISFVLKKAGAEVTICENGRDAVDEAWSNFQTETPYDVILMDMQMPIMDGYEATALLRSRGYPLPIIALTAHAMADDRRKCLDAGCDEFATKPIDRVQLIRGIVGVVWVCRENRLLRTGN
ncbi:MAG: response regulator [Planctomycetes bacterium]|nr:response regulator [Planctomycetota bacterium]